MDAHCQESDATGGAITTIPIVDPTTSIRVSKARTPIIIVGQDESIFAQYLLRSKTRWGQKVNAHCYQNQRETATYSQRSFQGN